MIKKMNDPLSKKEVLESYINKHLVIEELETELYARTKILIAKVVIDRKGLEITYRVQAEVHHDTKDCEDETTELLKEKLKEMIMKAMTNEY